jgi:hypothetical protein
MDQLDELINNNKRLQSELNDLEYLIYLREEELAILKNTASKVTELQSKLDHNLYEYEQMQNIIAEHQHAALGAKKRELGMEEEMLQSIEAENTYYTIKHEYESAQIMIDDLNAQLNEAVSLYKQIVDLRKNLSEVKSSLEIATLDNQFLREELTLLKTLEKNPLSE